MDLMQDLQVLAMQSDLTRVITFMMSKEQSARPYPQIGVPDAHHPLSHHNNAPELIERRTLLDNMTIIYGGGISNSTIHAGDNLPVLLVGGGAGSLNGGRHLHFDDEPTMADLHLSLLEKFGIYRESLGGSSGPLNI